MTPRVARQLAAAHDSDSLAAAIEAITEEQEPALEVEGKDAGEKLTHLLLAARIRARMDSGEELKQAFRAEMAGVREVLTNA